jgi:alpha-1,3-rhamnosyl/mannosyltransferase
VRIALDLGVLAHSRGGVARYTRGLAGGLAEILAVEDDSLSLVDVPASHPGVPAPPEAEVLLPDPPYLRVPLLRRIPIRLGWEQRSRAERLESKLGEVDVYHHGGTQPSAPESAVSVVTLFDTSAWEHPGWHTRSTLEYCTAELGLIGGGSRLLAISRWAACRAEGLLGLDEGSIGVAPGGAADMFAPGAPRPAAMKRMGLEADGYLLHVGSYVPRKNIPMLLAAYGAARERGLRLPLVMVGAESWGGVEVPKAAGVVPAPSVDDGTLLDLYRGARCLLLPSRYEGLGLPVLEALACGTPVVCSDATALPETLAGGGLLLDPEETDAWAEVMESLSDAEYSAELRRRAEKAETRSWRDTARDALAFYREVAGA